MELKASLALATLMALLLLPGCAARGPRIAQVPSAPLIAADGAALDARDLVAHAPLTVIVFFSRDCHCLDRHDGRIRELYAAYHPRGVQLLMVDPEVRACPDVDEGQARRRGYRFPILIDRGARLADALGAQYATYTVIVDAAGRVRYRGGFDSDKTHLRDRATSYVRDALDDLLAGRPARIAEAKTLGCSLEKW